MRTLWITRYCVHYSVERCRIENDITIITLWLQQLRLACWREIMTYVVFGTSIPKMLIKLIILQKMSTILISSAALDSMKRMALSHKWGSSIIKRGASMAMKRDVLIYGMLTQKPSRCIFVKISVEKIYVYSCGVEMTLTITVSTMIHIFLNELGVHWFGHFCWTLTKDLQKKLKLEFMNLFSTKHVAELLRNSIN